MMISWDVSDLVYDIINFGKTLGKTTMLIFAQCVHSPLAHQHPELQEWIES